MESHISTRRSIFRLGDPSSDWGATQKTATSPIARWDKEDEQLLIAIRQHVTDLSQREASVA